MRVRPALLLMLALLIGADGLLLPALAQEPAREEETERELLAAFNEWRLDENLWPLQRNATLDGLALLQAQYLASLSSVQGGEEIHRGRQGEMPRDRALWGPFNWPTYGGPTRMALEEIAYAGRNIADALNFWMHSAVHRAASTNPAYREFGAAVLPRGRGQHVYIIVLAARPNVLPVVADPLEGLLYLTNEVYWGAAFGGIRRATEVRVLDSRGDPLTDWQPWQETLPLPETTGDTIYVEYSDGETQITTVVRLAGREDVMLLPELLPTPTPPEPTPTSTPGPSPTPSPNVLLVYNPRSLTLINISRRSLDLGGLAFTDGERTLATERWEDRMETSASVFFFPPGDCLQAWLYTEREQPKPQSCGTRHAWVGVQPDELPWTVSDFDVLWFGQVLMTCSARSGQCAFYLP